MKNINCKTKIKLIETIKKSGLTIGKIALISGVKERTIMNWIYNSDSMPSIENAEKIFNALGYEIEIKKLSGEEK